MSARIDPDDVCMRITILTRFGYASRKKAGNFCDVDVRHDRNLICETATQANDNAVRSATIEVSSSEERAPTTAPVGVWSWAPGEACRYDASINTSAALAHYCASANIFPVQNSVKSVLHSQSYIPGRTWSLVKALLCADVPRTSIPDGTLPLHPLSAVCLLSSFDRPSSKLVIRLPGTLCATSAALSLALPCLYTWISNTTLTLLAGSASLTQR
nr:hypothetical protein CFP56_43879 [Quercus suber]